MLHIDLTIMTCPDERLYLQTPAAMRRGLFHHEHGALIDGQRWLLGDAPPELPSETEPIWTQAGGINAGIMLFQSHYLRMIREVHCAS